MPQYVFFIGSHPDLSATECWRFLTMHNLNPRLLGADSAYIIIETSEPLDVHSLSQLGGVERVGEIVKQTSEELSEAQVMDMLSPLPEKFSLGISAINTSAPKTHFLVNIKKAVRKAGSRLAFVEPKKGTNRLNSAHVLFHGLYRAPNVELTVIKTSSNYIWAKTIWVQDIQAYEKRDTGKPARDPKIGMLPPKLAQTMLTFAGSAVNKKTGQKLSIFDPFCGSGVILQEGWLDGYTMTGSDINPNMVKASIRNLEWVKQLTPTKNNLPLPTVFLHDVNNSFIQELFDSFDAVVSEPFLGKPLTSPLAKEERDETINSLSELYKLFFRHIYPLLRKDGAVVFALPIFKQQKNAGSYEWLTMPNHLIDEISEIGYRNESLVPKELTSYYGASERGTIIYSRPDALVGREITLWHKI